MKNEFKKYWHPKFKDWHENIIGVYHISSIGNNHQDLKYNKHSGPCLRQTNWEYTDPLPNSDETEGNFEEGDEHHDKLERIVKKWKPNTVIEKPLAKLFTRDGKTILIIGSIDIEYHHLFDVRIDTDKTIKQISIWDIKTASSYTLPKDKYDYNPTHFDQVSNYGTFDYLFELNNELTEIKRLKIIYVSKHNKATFVQRQKFELDEGLILLDDLIERSFYLHDCLLKKEIPVPEPMKWCKYCKYLKRCMEQGDIEIIYSGGGKYIKGIKLKELIKDDD